MLISDRTVLTHMDRDRFRCVSNFDLAERNRIGDFRYACIRLLFANMHLEFNDVRCSRDCSSNVSYFFVADVKCGLCEFRNTQKQQRKCSTWNMDRVWSTKCAETELE